MRGRSLRQTCRSRALGMCRLPCRSTVWAAPPLHGVFAPACRGTTSLRSGAPRSPAAAAVACNKPLSARQPYHCQHGSHTTVSTTATPLAAAQPHHCQHHSHTTVSITATPLSAPQLHHCQHHSHPTVSMTATPLSAPQPHHCQHHSHTTVRITATPLSAPQPHDYQHSNHPTVSRARGRNSGSLVVRGLPDAWSDYQRWWQQ